jgi:hypothetical protein
MQPSLVASPCGCKGWGALSRLDTKVTSCGGFGLDVLQGLRSRLVYEAILDGRGGRMAVVVSWAGDCIWLWCLEQVIAYGCGVLSRWLHVLTCKRRFHSVLLDFVLSMGKFMLPIEDPVVGWWCVATTAVGHYFRLHAPCLKFLFVSRMQWGNVIFITRFYFLMNVLPPFGI